MFEERAGGKLEVFPKFESENTSKTLSDISVYVNFKYFKLRCNGQSCCCENFGFR